MSETWVNIFDVTGAICLLIGCTFTLIAALGLFRFHDVFTRMHAASKPQLLGLLFICTGITLHFRTWHWLAVCTLIIAIQVVAAPVGSHLLGRTAYRDGLVNRQTLIRDDLADYSSSE